MIVRRLPWVLFLVQMMDVSSATVARSGRPGANWDMTKACTTLKRFDFTKIEDAPTYVISTKWVQAAEDVSSYCRVQGFVRPKVGFFLGLPSTWNGKFMEVGCGGGCGAIAEQFAFSTDCLSAMRRGYACIASDSGHR